MDYIIQVGAGVNLRYTIGVNDYPTEAQDFSCSICGHTWRARVRYYSKCPKCHPRSPRKSPSPEVRKRISSRLKGRKFSEERVRNIRAGVARSRAEGKGRKDPASHNRGKPAYNAVPVGTERIRPNGRVAVKCQDGKWRWRSHAVWFETFGWPADRGYILHHIDEDPSNDDFWNLMRVTRAEHAAIHMTARKRQKVSAIKRIQNRNQ